MDEKRPPSKKVQIIKGNINKSFITRDSLELLVRLSVRNKPLAGRLISSGVLLRFR